MNCYTSKLFSSITVLTSRPIHYAPAPTTSRTIPEELTPPRKQFLPFIVPAPVTPPTKIIYPAPPTTFPTNLISFEEEPLPVLYQFILIPPPGSPSLNFVPSLPVQG